MKIQDLINHFDGNQELQDKIYNNWNKHWPEKLGDTSNMEEDEEDLKEVLRGAFVWGATKDGHSFWDHICKSLPSS